MNKVFRAPIVLPTIAVAVVVALTSVDPIYGFVQPNTLPIICSKQSKTTFPPTRERSCIEPVTIRPSYSFSTTLFAKIWDRLQIEEDSEPMWYVLNCVAGLEMDLLRQCRQRCEDLEDVVKFVVPTVKTIRSHGANRMITEIKVKYQGYVFAKLRLCPETYEAIQGKYTTNSHWLDICL